MSSVIPRRGFKNNIKTNNQNNTKQSFNNIAQNYDSRDNQNPIIQWMRGIVHKVYLQHIPSGSKVLELNAGTGVDAVFLAGKGMNVYSTDISDEMIDIIEAKVKSKKAKNIKAAALSFDEIDKVTDSNFDVVISNFGGLNCINDFSKLTNDLAQKLKPGGLFIAVVMNKICPWEIFYYIITLNFREAFRRFAKNGIMAELNGEKVLTYYFTPKKFYRSFSQNFTVQKIYALGYYTPPPYLIGVYKRFKLFVKFFMKTDDLIKGIFPVNRFGDHFIIVMKMK